jgi:ABC-2 type transport system permease protein
VSPRVIRANLVVSLKTFSREKSAMFFTIAFPIILILVFGTIFLNQDNASFDLHVQDLDQTNSSAQLVKALELNGKVKITAVDPAIDATQYAKDRKVSLVLVIPRGYEKGARAEVGIDGWHPECGVPRPERVGDGHVHLRCERELDVHEDPAPPGPGSRW